MKFLLIEYEFTDWGTPHYCYDGAGAMKPEDILNSSDLLRTVVDLIPARVCWNCLAKTHFC